MTGYAAGAGMESEMDHGQCAIRFESISGLLHICILAHL